MLVFTLLSSYTYGYICYLKNPMVLEKEGRRFGSFAVWYFFAYIEIHVRLAITAVNLWFYF